MSHMLSLFYALTRSRHEFSLKRPYTQPRKNDTWGPAAPPAPPAPPSLASLMRTGPCVFDPAASPAASQPHAYSTLPAASPVTPPSPRVPCRCEAQTLPGRCWISKPQWMKLIHVNFFLLFHRMILKCFTHRWLKTRNAFEASSSN